MIIIEGPDKVGKTTLAHALVKRLNEMGRPVVYRHLTKLPRGFNYYWDYVPMFDRNVVMDRMYASRWAYGMALANQEVPSPWICRLLDGHLDRIGGMHVLVTATERFLREQFERDRERAEMYDLEQVLRVNEAFKKSWDERAMRYDYHVVLDKCDAMVSQGWPTDHLDKIVSAYDDKQLALDGLLCSPSRHDRRVLP